MTSRARTTVLRCLTLESSDQEDIEHSAAPSAVVDALLPLLERALAGESNVPIRPSQYWLTASEIQDGGGANALRATLGVGSPSTQSIMEMTLRPPEVDGEPAILMTSIGGWLQRITEGSLGDRPTADRIASELADLEKCISWTWLELRGYAVRPTNLSSPLEVLFSAGGGMLTAMVQEPGESPEVCFLVQNTPEAVRQLPETPPTAVYARMFTVRNVDLVPLVASIGDTWYESWINVWSDDGGGFEELDTLAKQDRIVFLIYDGTSLDPERSVQLSNPLTQPIAEFRRLMEAKARWTMDEFADAREELYAAYPTPRDLIFGADFVGE